MKHIIEKMIKKLLLLFVFLLLTVELSYAQNIKVDVNLNIKHSVEGVSDFGRDRHMTVHATPTETDWVGDEDKLDYLINDLDVYFGRDNGSATWKFRDTPEDPNRAAKPDISGMQERADYLKNIYDGEVLAHQYENKGAMIMGTNPLPTYPTLNWFDAGSTWHGWQPQTVETSAEWVTEYLDRYFKKNNGESGEPLPAYWEVINEPDMLMMTGQMMCTSQEKIWEYHNLVAASVKQRMGAKAPKIGGMTWGLHDLYLPDGLSRFAENHYDQWLTTESFPIYHAMIDSDVNTSRAQNWYQWDVMWQGFIDNCGVNMDFYGVHIYDWPDIAGKNNGVLRTGGQVEATLDMLEWYDNFKFSAKKDIVISEFGAVSSALDNISYERRAWENLRPFNAMFMQFLERPSHIVLSMPFCPIKAEWGDIRDANGNLIKRYQATLMDKDTNGDWQWNDFILFYELWKDVDGTRIDTKSNNLDIMVDAYTKDNHVYLILNNLKFDEQTLDLTLFDDYTNAITSVKMNHLFLDISKGIQGEAVMDERTFNTAPGSIKIAGEGTIILDYTFENPVTIDQTSDEKKFMGDRLGVGSTAIGGDKFRKTVAGRTPLNAMVNNVVVPAKGEAVLRIGARCWESAYQPSSITINGNALTLPAKEDWRGEVQDSRNVVFHVFEVDVPLSFLQQNNTITCQVDGNSVEYTTVMLQVFDFSKTPKRSEEIAPISVAALSIDESILGIMVGNLEALTATIAPEDASNKSITWSSADEAIATVDEFGIVTGVSIGSTTITATSVDGSFTDNTTTNVAAFSATSVTGISIDEGNSTNVTYYITTPLHANILPIDATEQNVVWSSSNPDNVEVDPNTGKVVGKIINSSATITATLTDPNNGNTIHTTSILVTVDAPANFIAVSGIEVSPVNRTLTAAGEEFQVSANVLPSNATVKTYTWSSNDTNVATVSESGLVTAIANGNAQIIATSTEGGYTSICNLTVAINNGGGNTLIIEAETFDRTEGTYVDGHVPSPYGVNRETMSINWVNSGDWAEYDINILAAGNYNIVYFISTPSDNAQIQIYVDNILISTDNVSNNGAWDTYGPLTALNPVTLTAGAHTIRIVASGSNAWQWNLDRIELQENSLTLRTSKVLNVNEPDISISSAYIYPNPVENVLTINGENLNGSYDMKIFNLNGGIVKKSKINGFPSTIDIDNLQDGFYLLSISNSNTKRIFKVVKMTK